MVGTKAFLLSVIMMPVFVLGSLLTLEVMKSATGVKQRRIAVIDHTGQLSQPIQVAADEKNRLVEKMMPLAESSSTDDDSTEDERALSVDLQPGFLGVNRDKYEIEFIDPASVDDQTLAKLSDQVREQQLYAFVEIPVAALNDEVGVAQDRGDEAGDEQQIRFFAMDSSLSEARRWLEQVVNNELRLARLIEADIDPEKVLAASQPVPVLGMGLVERASDGTLKTIQQTDAMSAIFLPMAVMLMMFMVVFMSSQPMLESVLEEKSQRIAEVLLGSCSPFELMCGKLLGTVAGSLTIFAIYIIGAFVIAASGGHLDQVPFELVPYFVLFQVVAVLFYASIFLAIGASVSQLKEAQVFLVPVWMLMTSPMFVWLFIVRDPLGPFATYFSLFPPTTPTAMMLRMATGQAIPVWQPILGLLLTIGATLCIVTIAGRIFRVGILWQGKTPKLREILKWAVTG